MNDMSSTIVAKSDQINAADLVGINRTITIKEVRIKAGDDQPVTILIEGDTKAFRPCKGVRRLLVRVWGPDAKEYIGQSLTIYCDPTVTWAGKPEGGIRVSHMTGLKEEIVEYMRTSREKTKPYKIEPLKVKPTTTADPAVKWAEAFIAKLDTFTTLDAIQGFVAEKQKKLAELEGARPDLHEKVATALTARLIELQPGASTFDDDDLTAGETVDKETGEVTDAATTAEPTADDEAHPGTAIADALIAEINAPETNAVMDVSRILTGATIDMQAMLPEDAKRVEDAADARRAEIRETLDKAKAREKAGAE